MCPHIPLKSTRILFEMLFFMPSGAELALLDALVCPNALALWGAVRSMMLVLADVRVYESGVAWWSLWAGWLWIDGWTVGCLGIDGQVG